MIFADVFGQTQVMQLARPERRRQVTMVTKAGRAVTTETHIMWKKGKKNKNKKKTNQNIFIFCLMRILRQRPKSSKVSRNVAHSRASRDGGMVLNDSFCVPPVRQSQGWSGWGSCRCGRPCTRPSGRAPWSLLPAGPTHRWSVETRQRSKCDDRNTRGRARVEVNETL